MAALKELHPAFRHRQYLLRGNAFGGTLQVYDGNGNLAFYSKRNVKMRETRFRVYSEWIELLTIESFGLFISTHNVHDIITGKAVGAIKSVNKFKGEWVFLSNEGEEIGRLTTESGVRGALSSRFVSLIMKTIFISLILRRYIIVSADGREVAQIRQHCSLLGAKYSLTIVELGPSIDRRLLIAAGILLADFYYV